MTILDCTTQALILVLLLSMPAITVAAVVGIIVSLLQAVTQIQDQTLSFAVKLIAIIVTLIVTARWVGWELLHFSENLFTLFPTITG